MIRFACPACQAVIKAPDERAGATAPCPRCRKPVRIPGGKAVAPAAASLSTAESFPAPVAPGLRPLLIMGGFGVALLLLVGVALGALVYLAKNPSSGPRSLSEDAQAAKESPLTAEEQRRVADLVEGLKSKDVATRYQAMLALEKLGRLDRSVVGALVEVLRDKTDSTVHSKLRLSAVRLLGQLGPAAEEAVPHLLVAVSDPSQEARFQALDALARIGKAGQQGLRDALYVKDKATRVQAASLLAKQGEEARPAVPALLDAIKDSDGDTRVTLAGHLVRIDPTNAEVVPVLAAGLKNANDNTRRSAAIALGLMGPNAKGAEDALYDAATLDLNGEVKIQATLALEKIRGER